MIINFGIFAFVCFFKVLKGAAQFRNFDLGFVPIKMKKAYHNDILYCWDRIQEMA